MRKHSVRKWIHALLDMLPLFIIPVFMVYSHRHTIDNYEVTTDKYEIVDFNQQSNFSYTITSNSAVRLVPLIINDDVLNNKYVFRTSHNFGAFQLWFSDLYFNNDWAIPNADAVNGSYSFTSPSVVTIQKSHLMIRNYPLDNYLDTYGNVTITLQAFNLTQMFGSGNEPSIEEFNQLFPDEYYEYTQSQKLLLKVGTETYNNTDIGSQLIYSMYNTINESFNFNNVFNFNQIYDWLQLNIFGGTAPLSVFIVWNIVLYEFIMDILFLFYMVFMFVVDFVESCIDKAFYKSHRGCE